MPASATPPPWSCRRVLARGTAVDILTKRKIPYRIVAAAIVRESSLIPDEREHNVIHENRDLVDAVEQSSRGKFRPTFLFVPTRSSEPLELHIRPFRLRRLQRPS